MAEDLLGLVKPVYLSGVDHQQRVVVGFELAALHVLHPAIVEHLADADALIGIGVQHLQHQAAQRWRVHSNVQGQAAWVV